jgi:hypothetical protein
MHEDLDLSVIERHHDADPRFREAVRTRLVGILDGTESLEVLDHRPVQSTEEEATMIDLETPSQTTAERKGPRRFVIAALLAAATVVGIALVVTRDDATPADQPSPTVPAPPTTPPRPLPHDGEQIVPGTYFVDEVSGTPAPRIFVTVGNGWSVPSSPIAVLHLWSAFGYMDFSHPVAVYSDACHWEDGYHPGPVDTVDGLVAALSEQQGWAEVTAPFDISVDGYEGKAFQRTTPTDMTDCSARRYRTRTSDDVGLYPDFRSWENLEESPGGSYYEPGQIETLRILDIDGTVVVISTALWPEPSAAAHADLVADVLNSIHIERA